MFGVVVDRGVISVGLSNLNGDVLGKRSERLPDMLNVQRMLDSIARHAKDIKAESCLTNDQILGMGLCIPTQHFTELGVIPKGEKIGFYSFDKAVRRNIRIPCCGRRIGKLSCFS